jgi:hypothetical protein
MGRTVSGFQRRDHREPVDKRGGSGLQRVEASAVQVERVRALGAVGVAAHRLHP